MHGRDSDKLRQINSGIDFKRILGSLLSKWHWFVLSLFVTCALGFLYLRYTTPLYSIRSLILIEDKQKGVGSLLNSRLVSRFGARRLSQGAVISMIVTNAIHIGVIASGHENMVSFMVFQSATMMAVAFTLLTTWARGRKLMRARMTEAALPISIFAKSARNSATPPSIEIRCV